MVVVSVVILAAGKGTRMRSSLPKVLHELSGRPMLFYIIDAALALSDDVTVVLGHEADRVQEAIERAYGKHPSIRFVKQDLARYPGTGGALKEVTPTHPRTMILNGDMPLVTKEALEPFLKQEGDVVMAIFEKDDPSGYGRVVIDDGMVQAIVEQKDCDEKQLAIKQVNAGVYLFDTDFLRNAVKRLDNNNAQQEYYLTDTVAMAVEAGKTVVPLRVEAQSFMGVNSKAHLAVAEEAMQDRIKAHWMSEGVTMRLPRSIYIDSRAIFEGECVIENGVCILGSAKIVHSHIKAHSVIDESVIEHSIIGPMAHIRPQSKITDSKIGNFVEVKKSTLDGVKAGHLSYLGDATIGSGTNIGAGVITCNYDGKAKYQTIIGNDVFVGSDSQLVAPVRIEDEVIIAAGTTVTKDVAKGELAISRAPLKRVKDFFYKFFGKADG